MITKEATEELNIQVGDAVEAVVKATGVMVAKAGCLKENLERRIFSVERS